MPKSTLRNMNTVAAISVLTPDCLPVHICGAKSAGSGRGAGAREVLPLLWNVTAAAAAGAGGLRHPVAQWHCGAVRSDTHTLLSRLLSRRLLTAALAAPQ